MKTKTIKNLLHDSMLLSKPVMLLPIRLLVSKLPANLTANIIIPNWDYYHAKAKTPVFLIDGLENQIHQQTCSCDELKRLSFIGYRLSLPSSQVQDLVFKVGVKLRPWVFAFGCGIGRKTCCVDGVTVGELAHQQTQQPHNTGCPSTLPQAKGFF